MPMMEPEIVEQVNYFGLVLNAAGRLVVGAIIGWKLADAVKAVWKARKTDKVPFVSHAVADEAPEGYTTVTTSFDPVPKKMDPGGFYYITPTEVPEGGCAHEFVEQWRDPRDDRYHQLCTGCGARRSISGHVMAMTASPRKVWESVPWKKKQGKKKV